MGRSLIDGAREVKLFGETIDVRAHIASIKGMSSHADVNGLLEWIQAFEKKPDMVFTVHGDDQVCDIFADRLTKELGFNASAPFSGSVFDLIEGKWITQTAGVPVEKTVTPARKRSGICPPCGRGRASGQGYSPQRRRSQQRPGKIRGADSFAVRQMGQIGVFLHGKSTDLYGRGGQGQP